MVRLQCPIDFERNNNVYRISLEMDLVLISFSDNCKDFFIEIRRDELNELKKLFHCFPPWDI